MLSCLLIGLTAMEGESLLDFPRLSNQSGNIVGVAIVNPGGLGAKVTVTAGDVRPLAAMVE